MDLLDDATFPEPVCQTWPPLPQASGDELRDLTVWQSLHLRYR